MGLMKWVRCQRSADLHHDQPGARVLGSWGLSKSGKRSQRSDGRVKPRDDFHEKAFT